jgi:hypothetical protein
MKYLKQIYNYLNILGEHLMEAMIRSGGQTGW